MRHAGIALACLGVFGAASFAPREALADREENPAGATGLKPHTPEERAWVETEVPRVKTVHPNAIGLRRLNAERALRGEPPLPAAAARPFGRDVEVDLPTAKPPSGGGGGTTPPLPASVDNGQAPWFPPIGNQLALGACAPFAIVYHQMTSNTGLVRGWKNANPYLSTKFSPAWAYNLTNDGVDAGSSVFDVYGLIGRHGAPSWAEFPYSGFGSTPTNYRAWDRNPTHWASALEYRTAAMRILAPVDSASGLAKVKALLNNGYVVAFGTWIRSWKYKTFSNDPSTAADDALAGRQVGYLVDGRNGGHEMVVVGYHDAAWTDVNGNGVVDSGEKGAFRIANSWGTHGAEGGFLWLAYDALAPRSRVRNGPNPASRETAFWYNEVTHLEIRPSYAPRLLAAVTLEHASRSQLTVELGVSSAGAASAASTWPANALWAAGGSFAFDGTTSAVPATFVFDLTDLVPETTAIAPKRYWLKVTDTAAGSPATIHGFRVIDPHTGLVEATAAAVPRTVDAGTAWIAADFDGALPVFDQLPVADFTATADPVDPRVVTLDGTRSFDPDATDAIASYVWQFGDWVSAAASGPAEATGSVVTHTFPAAGTYEVRLTVTDGIGGFATERRAITVGAPAAVTLADAPASR